MEPRARDDLEGFRRSVLAHEHRHDDAMAAHRGQNVGDIGCFFENRMLDLLTDSLPRSIKSSFITRTPSECRSV
jgi:hypothetical protein